MTYTISYFPVSYTVPHSPYNILQLCLIPCWSVLFFTMFEDANCSSSPSYAYVKIPTIYSSMLPLIPSHALCYVSLSIIIYILALLSGFHASILWFLSTLCSPVFIHPIPSYLALVIHLSLVIQLIHVYSINSRKLRHTLNADRQWPCLASVQGASLCHAHQYVLQPYRIIWPRKCVLCHI